MRSGEGGSSGNGDGRVATNRERQRTKSQRFGAAPVSATLGRRNATRPQTDLALNQSFRCLKCLKGNNISQRKWSSHISSNAYRIGQLHWRYKPNGLNPAFPSAVVFPSLACVSETPLPLSPYPRACRCAPARVPGAPTHVAAHPRTHTRSCMRVVDDSIRSRSGAMVLLFQRICLCMSEAAPTQAKTEQQVSNGQLCLFARHSVYSIPLHTCCFSFPLH